jgi:succinate dehydrogenase/fumarate reductase flavoprotein subunit
MLVLRTRRGLTETLQIVQQLSTDAMSSLSVTNAAELIQALELQNLLLVGEMVGRAALLRTESRGGHYREDYPKRDDANWLRAIAIRRDEGRMQLDTFVIDPTWQDLPGDLGDWFWG